MKVQVDLRILAAVVVGFLIGNFSFQPVNAETNLQGDTIRICINKKNGNLRASSNCNSLEKSATLGAQGPKGDIGPQGPKGETGPQGPRGDAGVTPNMKLQTIYYLGGTSCNYRNAEYSYITDILRSPQSGAITWFGKGTLAACYLNVYTE